MNEKNCKHNWIDETTTGMSYVSPFLIKQYCSRCGKVRYDPIDDRNIKEGERGWNEYLNKIKQKLHLCRK